MAKKTTRLVKVTTKGRVQLTLNPLAHDSFVMLVETFIANYRSEPISYGNAAARVDALLMAELYQANLLKLRFRSPFAIKITITFSQAVSFWKQCQSFDRAYDNPAIGILLLQLHQTMSSQ